MISKSHLPSEHVSEISPCPLARWSCGDEGECASFEIKFFVWKRFMLLDYLKLDDCPIMKFERQLIMIRMLEQSE